MAAGIVVTGLVLGLVTDTIRLGPSEVALPVNAIIVTLEIIRISDGDPVYDYYYVVVTVSNTVDDPLIHPYAATVKVETNAHDGILGHMPAVEDQDTPFSITFPDIDRTYTFPAGTVSYRERGPGTGEWTARGESSLRSRPIFRSDASFLLKVRIDEGMSIRGSSVVGITWYYHSAVQAYPVATRTITTPTLVIPSGRPST